MDKTKSGELHLQLALDQSPQTYVPFIITITFSLQKPLVHTISQVTLLLDCFYGSSGTLGTLHTITDSSRQLASHGRSHRLGIFCAANHTLSIAHELS